MKAVKDRPPEGVTHFWPKDPWTRDSLEVLTFFSSIHWLDESFSLWIPTHPLTDRVGEFAARGGLFSNKMSKMKKCQIIHWSHWFFNSRRLLIQTIPHIHMTHPNLFVNCLHECALPSHQATADSCCSRPAAAREARPLASSNGLSRVALWEALAYH